MTRRPVKTSIEKQKEEVLCFLSEDQAGLGERLSQKTLIFNKACRSNKTSTILYYGAVLSECVTQLVSVSLSVL